MSSVNALFPNVVMDLDLSSDDPDGNEWGGFLWGTGSWSSTFVASDIVTDRVLSISTNRGRRHFLDPVSTGVATVTLNNSDGALDDLALPTNNPIIIRAQEPGSAAVPPVFTGRVLRADLDTNPTTLAGTVVLTCQDDLQPLVWDTPTIGDVIGADGDTGTERIAALLDYAAYPYDLVSRSLAADGTLSTPITFSTSPTATPTTLRQQAEDVAKLCGGMFFVNKNGVYTYYGPDYFASDPFLWAIIESGTDYSWRRWPVVLSNDRVLNDVRIDNGAGVSTALDYPSIGLVGRRSLQISSTLHDTAAGRQATANMIRDLAVQRGAMTEGIVVHASAGDWATRIPTLDLGGQVELERNGTTRGFIEGLQHRWTTAGGWETTMYVSTAWPNA